MKNSNRHLTILGLGPGAVELLSLQALEALRQATHVILRTERHPAAEGLRERGIAFTACDDLYERHGTFPEVYAAITARVLDATARESRVAYAVPGDPRVAERTVRLLLDAAGELPGLDVAVLPALSALDLIFHRLGLDPGEGVMVLDARDPRLRPANEAPELEDREAYHGAAPLINPTLPAVWLQVDTAMVASNLKILLLEQYPPEHEVTVLTAVGADEERVTALPLADLDRGVPITHLTSVYVPVLPWPQRRHTLADLRAIMALLRGERGCPWDRAQEFTTLRRTVIEEAYEVADAIDRDDHEMLADELGDVLLNVIFVARLGAEEGLFDLDDVAQALGDKLIRRHAHVFGEVEAKTAGAALSSWEQLKAGERAAKTSEIFHDVPLALPALARSQKLQKRAARVGFDWVDFRGPLLKLFEETEELLNEFGMQAPCEIPDILKDPLTPHPGIERIVDAAPRARLAHEIGDLLFAAVNLCRFVHLDAEEVMREANNRFARRFRRVEAVVHSRGLRMEDLPLAELDRIWMEIKGED